MKASDFMKIGIGAVIGAATVVALNFAGCTAIPAIDSDGDGIVTPEERENYAASVEMNHAMVFEMINLGIEIAEGEGEDVSGARDALSVAVAASATYVEEIRGGANPGEASGSFALYRSAIRGLAEYRSKGESVDDPPGEDG